LHGYTWDIHGSHQVLSLTDDGIGIGLPHSTVWFSNGCFIIIWISGNFLIIPMISPLARIMHTPGYEYIYTKTSINSWYCYHESSKLMIHPPGSQPMAKRDEIVDSYSSGINLMEGSDPGIFCDPLWTVEDVADYLKLQPETIRAMARRGELPALKIGKVWRFQKQAIHEMLINLY
jgi:excisionase family DNA binding protein